MSTCGETADSGWGTHECHLRDSHEGKHRCRCDQEWRRADPEPVECPDCGGSGRLGVTVKGNVTRPDCGRCDGQGVVERER